MSSFYLSPPPPFHYFKVVSNSDSGQATPSFSAKFIISTFFFGRLSYEIDSCLIVTWSDIKSVVDFVAESIVKSMSMVQYNESQIQIGTNQLEHHYRTAFQAGAPIGLSQSVDPRTIRYHIDTRNPHLTDTLYFDLGFIAALSKSTLFC